MKMHRPEGVLERGEYLSRAREVAQRGQDLPRAKLLDLDVIAIRSAVVQRQNLRNHIAQNLSNEALAQKFGVHVRTIEKAVQRETWGHI
jgi:hypothetical protein